MEKDFVICIQVYSKEKDYNIATLINEDNLTLEAIKDIINISKQHLKQFREEEDAANQGEES